MYTKLSTHPTTQPQHHNRRHKHQIQPTLSPSPRTILTDEETLPIFEHQDVFFQILSKLTSHDCRTLRHVCKRLLTLFDLTYAQDHPVPHFWQRTCIRIWPNQLINQTESIDGKFSFLLKHNAKFSLLLRNRKDFKAFLRLLNDGNLKANITKLHSVYSITSRNNPSLLHKILDIIKTKHTYFPNLKKLKLNDLSLIHNYPIPNCIKHIKAITLISEVFLNTPNIKSLTISQFNENASFIFQASCSIKSLTIIKALFDLRILLKNLPLLISLNINKREILFTDKSDGNSVIISYDQLIKSNTTTAN